MENITWLDIIKISIPVFAVILAAGFALFNLRHSIKLQEKNKWKEDFRESVAEYLESVLKFGGNSLEVKKSVELGKANMEHFDKILSSSTQTLGRFHQILMMLEKKDPDTLILQKLFKDIQDEVLNLINGKSDNVEMNNHLEKFFEVAKRIHDKK